MPYYNSKPFIHKKLIIFSLELWWADKSCWCLPALFRYRKCLSLLWAFLILTISLPMDFFSLPTSVLTSFLWQDIYDLLYSSQRLKRIQAPGLLVMRFVIKCILLFFLVEFFYNYHVGFVVVEVLWSFY